MDEEEVTLFCSQCGGAADSLEPCIRCGKELCSSCQPECQECKDEQKDEKKRRWKAKRKAMEPERTTGQKIGRAIDWMTSTADGALGRELEHWPGEFDMFAEHGQDEAIQEMIRERYKRLPDWKKKLYKTKRKGEKLATKAALKTASLAGRLVRATSTPMGGPEPDFAELDTNNQHFSDEEDYEQGIEDNEDYEDETDEIEGLEEEDVDESADLDFEEEQEHYEEEEAEENAESTELDEDEEDKEPNSDEEIDYGEREEY